MTGVIEIPSSPSSSESNSHAELNRNTLRAYLEECLTNIQSNGSFAMFESSNNAPNPCIHLRGAGVIGLPLSDRDAKAIVEASHEAPFGKGEKTIVDTKVRRTWEISPAEFQLRNPAWNTFIKSIVAKVSAGLGIDAASRGVRAELYKMLLYEKGAMFKPHQDSEKAPHMFATLVVALPSKHEGGEVRVTHAGETKVFETSKSSEFDFSYLAWFADVTHEVKPVLSGRRLVLTYNLIHTSLGSKELAANSSKRLAMLRLAFSWWKNNLEDQLLPTYLAYLFKHQYTDASLSYDGLKGHDRQVAAHLREVCTEYGFCVYLANLERSVYGGCDEDDDETNSAGFHDIIEECDKEASLKRVVDLDCSEVARDLEFDEETLIQKEPFEEVDPDDEDYSGFTGNEGVSTTHFYHRTVVIVVPKSRRIEFLLSPSSTKKDEYWYRHYEKVPEEPRVIAWLDSLTEELCRNPSSITVREDLVQICDMVIRQTYVWKARPPPIQQWQLTGPAPFSDEVLTRIVTTTVVLDSKKMFVDAYYHCSGKRSLPMFRSVGTALVRYDLQSLLPSVSSHIALVNEFSDRFDIIEEIRGGLGTEAKLISRDPAVYLDWIQSEVNRAISSAAMISARDGSILADISKQLHSQEVFNRILPVVKRYVNHTPMAMAFLRGLFDASGTRKVTENVVNTIFKDVISDLIDQFSLWSLDRRPGKSNKRLIPGSRWESRNLDRTKTAILPDHDSSQNIASLLCHCLSLGLENELEQIITKLAGETINAPIDLFEIIYIPFLKVLINKLHERNLSTPNSPFTRLFQMILTAYIVRYVEPEPASPKDWTRSTVSCGCNDCERLDAFLRAPDNPLEKFAFGKKRREHLQGRLDRSSVTLQTEKRGSQYVLVVKKNRAEYLAAHKAWTGRYNIAKKHIEDLGTETLRDLLLDIYNPVMSLSAISLLPAMNAWKDSSPLPPLMSNENASDRILPPITRRKVPAKVIVIDD